MEERSSHSSNFGYLLNILENFVVLLFWDLRKGLYGHTSLRILLLFCNCDDNVSAIRLRVYCNIHDNSKILLILTSALVSKEHLIVVVVAC